MTGIILVTGASGFVGKNVACALIKSRRVRVLARRTSRLEELAGRGIEIAFGDLDSGYGLDRALDGVDAVVHSAARVRGRSPYDFFRTNVRGSAKLVTAMTRSGVGRLLFLSSHAVCPDQDYRHPVDENSPVNPLSAYGRSKKHAEDLVRASGLEYVILRPTAVYGPHDMETYKYLRLLARGFYPVVGGGEKYLNFIYVRDLAALVLQIIGAGAFNRATYFVSDGQCYAMDDTVKTIAGILGCRMPRKIPVPLPLGMLIGMFGDVFFGADSLVGRDKIRELAQPCWTCNPGRLFRELGFKARYDFRAGMTETIDWYRARGHLR